MAEDNPNFSDLIEMLPQRIKTRFNSIGHYVREIIEEEQRRLGLTRQLSTDQIQSIQLAALTYSLQIFFSEGSRVARAASVSFEQFGADGFEVGSTVFTQNNESTRRGEILAERLNSRFSDTPFFRYFSRASSIRELVTLLVREGLDVTNLD